MRCHSTLLTEDYCIPSEPNIRDHSWVLHSNEERGDGRTFKLCDQSSEVISRCELIGIRLPLIAKKGYDRLGFVQEQPERS